MEFLNFKIKKNTVKGKGLDVNGMFNIQGQIASDGHLEFTKQYVGKHAVEYKGRLTYQEIEGSWAIPSYGLADGFKLVVRNIPS